MSLDESISELIKRIYCAGEDPGAWDDVALEVIGACNGSMGWSTVVDLENRNLKSYRYYGPESSQVETGIREYADTYAADPALLWASRNVSGRFCDSRHTLPADEYLTNEFIRWNHARFGSTHWHVGYSTPDHDLSFSFSVHFPARAPVHPASVQLFKMLFDHMECAVLLGRPSFNLASERALILLDPTGKVRRLSAGAERMLRPGGALSLQERRLTATNPGEQARLDKAIAASLNTVRVGTRPQAIELHPTHGPRWIVVLRPMLSNCGPFGQVRCELMAEIHDGLPRIGSVSILQSLFDLTGRESQVVRLLADGHSVDTLADLMGISPNTAKTHMRAIFAKTQTNRQSELMHLCAGLGAEP